MKIRHYALALAAPMLVVLVAAVALVATAVDRSSIRMARECRVGNATFHGFAHFLIGEPFENGSVYANCRDGTAICYEDDGVRGTIDRAIACADVAATTPPSVLGTRARSLGLYSPPDRVWPNRVVCVRMGGEFSASVLALFRKAFVEFATKADVLFVDIQRCVKMYGTDTPVCNACQQAITIDNTQGDCRVDAGFKLGEFGRTMLLSRTCESYYMILRSLANVVGLHDEHAHPEREVIVLRDKLTAMEATGYVVDVWSIERPYDLHSVTHARGPELCLPRDASVRYCSITHTEQDGCVVPTEMHCDRSRQHEIGSSTMLSEQDVATILAMYATTARHPKSPLASQAP